jgi:ABC-type transporter Mla subunit MlaD
MQIEKLGELLSKALGILGDLQSEVSALHSSVKSFEDRINEQDQKIDDMMLSNDKRLSDFDAKLHTHRPLTAQFVEMEKYNETTF